MTVLGIVGAVDGQGPSEQQVRIERAQAEREVPQLAEVLELKPGMTVADVGAGGGAITVVLGKWIGSGRVFATDIGAPQLQLIRDYVMREGLGNVTVIEGRATSTNLPDACCDAIFLRDVYHHLSDPEPFNKSLLASLKPGGRLAVIDFVPDQGSKPPAGVPANREGHGITPRTGDLRSGGSRPDAFEHHRGVAARRPEPALPGVVPETLTRGRS